jgi:hypothetical protein
MPRRTATADENLEVQNLDVDVPQENDEVEDLSDAPVESEGGEKPAKKAAAKEPSRGQLPDGHVTPVGLAHALSQPLDGNPENLDPSNWRYTKKTDGSHVVAPQMVYSYIKNASKDDPFPGKTVQDSLGKDRENVVTLEEGLAWWDNKAKRTEERRQNAAAKAAAKAERAATKEKAEGEQPDVEATSVEEAE